MPELTVNPTYLVPVKLFGVYKEKEKNFLCVLVKIDGKYALVYADGDFAGHTFTGETMSLLSLQKWLNYFELTDASMAVHV